MLNICLLNLLNLKLKLKFLYFIHFPSNLDLKEKYAFMRLSCHYCTVRVHRIRAVTRNLELGGTTRYWGAQFTQQSLFKNCFKNVFKICTKISAKFKQFLRKSMKFLLSFIIIFLKIATDYIKNVINFKNYIKFGQKNLKNCKIVEKISEI